MKKQFLLAAAVSSLTILPLTAQAAPTGDSGVIFGVNGVRDDGNLDDLVGSGSTDAGWGWDLYLGYAFNRYFTLRGGQRYFGEIEVKEGSQKLSLDGDGLYLAGDFMWPVSDRFSLGATLGVQKIDADLELKQAFSFPSGGGSYTVSESDDARDWFYGLRAEWVLGESSSFVAFYNRYSFDIADADEDLEYDSLGLGLEWRF